MKALKDGWHAVSRVDQTRVYIDNGEPTCVATRSADLDAAGDRAAQWWGKPLELDTWFCLADSPHAALVSDDPERNWSGQAPSRDWMFAGVDVD